MSETFNPIGTVLEALKARKAKQEALRQEFHEISLPPSVSYCLSHNEGFIDSDAMDSIERKYPPMAYYFLAKALSITPDLQKAYLTDSTRLFLDGATYRETVDRLNHRYREIFEKTGAKLHVKGNKIAQVNRNGLERWSQGFQELGKRIVSRDPKHTYILLHASLSGFREILDPLQQTNSTIQLLLPENIANPNIEHIGYSWSWDSHSYRNMKRNEFCDPEGVYVDDTKNTGETFKTVWNQVCKSRGIPYDENRLMVLSDLS